MALVAQGLTLQQNEAPMGTMQLVNASIGFAQSPGPLALEAAALEAYFGGLHAGAQNEQAWWSAIAPGVAMPPQLSGAAVVGHDSPLNVEIDSAGGTPTQVVLRTTVTLSGGAAPGEYAETATLPFTGHRSPSGAGSSHDGPQSDPDDGTFSISGSGGTQDSRVAPVFKRQVAGDPRRTEGLDP